MDISVITIIVQLIFLESILSIDMIVKESFHIHLGEVAQFAISVSILVLTILVARSSVRDFDFLWKPIIGFFKVLHAPFALMQQLVRRGA